MAAMMKSILRRTGHWPLVAFVCTALAVFSGGIDAPHFKIVQPAHAGWQSRDSNHNIAISTPSCSQATTLLGRMDGSQNTAAATNLICGMERTAIGRRFSIPFTSRQSIRRRTPNSIRFPQASQ
jgi:hypothetical protein